MNDQATDRPLFAHRRSWDRAAMPLLTAWRMVRRAPHRAAILVFGVAIVSARAADDNKIFYPGVSAGGSAPTSAAGGGVMNAVTLVLAVLLAAVGTWMIWRNRRGAVGTRDSRNLAVEETRSLGNRQYLVVASFEGRRFLLGVCPGRIDMLAPLDDRKRTVEAA